MIAHVVLFRPKAEVPAAERRALAERFAAAVREIPSVRRARIGRRVTHGAGYEQLPQPDFTFAAVLEFDDQAGLKAYLQHPAHAEPGRRLFEVMEAGVVFDYALLDGRDADVGVGEWLG